MKFKINFEKIGWLKKAGNIAGNVTSNKTFLNIAMLLCTTVFLFSLYNIGLWVYENRRTDDIKNELLDKGNKNKEENLVPAPAANNDEVDINRIKFLTTDLKELKKTNPDTVAWIKVMGTYVDYPVVQTDNNDYYLTHDFYKAENKAGWIFGDFRNDFSVLQQNTIIYGHERMDYSMFGSLTYCMKDWWYKKKTNHFVFLNTENQKTVWQIFSIYVTSTDFNYIKTWFADDIEYGEFVKSLNARNQIPSLKADATANDKILTLSTCYNFNKRLVVTAKLVKTEDVNPKKGIPTVSSPSSQLPNVSSDISSSNKSSSSNTHSAPTGSSSRTASNSTPSSGRSSNPPSSNPPSSNPPSSNPPSSEPTSTEPTSSEPPSSEPTSSEPTSTEPTPSSDNPTSQES